MNKRSEQQNDLFGQFNLNDFKKWIGHQPDSKSRTNMLGLQVESKIPIKKLVDRMEAQEGEVEDIIKDFKKSGGLIKDVDGPNVLIEVSSGTFLVHRMYVKRIDD